MDVKDFADASYDELLELIRQLCAVTAPSGKEEKRAEYCCEWLKENGAEGVYIDDALNVIFPYNCDGSNEITVFVAHTDTVFPDEEAMPFFEDKEKMYSPGVGDDTASVAVLLMLARYLVKNKITPKRGFLLVCNSGEEGLGNLKGTRKLMESYKGRIADFISFDSFKLDAVHDGCVGSHRYEVEVLTEGGHSFEAFGNKNAICELSKIVAKIYETEVPVQGNSRTTYNVGNIIGGTSVNTIAQKAKMLCEYRSDNVGCLEVMKERFLKIFSEAQKDGVKVNVTNIGERPCESGVDEEKKKALLSKCGEAIKEVTGKNIITSSASTDCNIPLSMGIPAICIGVFEGEKQHTREEWIYKKSVRSGLEIAIKTALKLCRN